MKKKGIKGLAALLAMSTLMSCPAFASQTYHAEYDGEQYNIAVDTANLFNFENIVEGQDYSSTMKFKNDSGIDLKVSLLSVENALENDPAVYDISQLKILNGDTVLYGTDDLSLADAKFSIEVPDGAEKTLTFVYSLPFNDQPDNTYMGKRMAANLNFTALQINAPTETDPTETDPTETEPTETDPTQPTNPTTAPTTAAPETTAHHSSGGGGGGTTVHPNPLATTEAPATEAPTTVAPTTAAPTTAAPTTAAPTTAAPKTTRRSSSPVNTVIKYISKPFEKETETESESETAVPVVTEPETTETEPETLPSSTEETTTPETTADVTVEFDKKNHHTFLEDMIMFLSILVVLVLVALGIFMSMKRRRKMIQRQDRRKEAAAAAKKKKEQEAEEPDIPDEPEEPEPDVGDEDDEFEPHSDFSDDE